MFLITIIFLVLVKLINIFSDMVGIDNFENNNNVNQNNNNMDNNRNQKNNKNKVKFINDEIKFLCFLV